MTNMLVANYEEGHAPTPREADVVEIPLLLPLWQVSALEKVAHARGMTAASMVRQLLLDFIAESTSKSKKKSSRRDTELG